MRHANFAMIATSSIEAFHDLISHYQVTPVYRGWLYVFVPARTTTTPAPAPPPPPPLAADSCSRDLDFFHSWHDCWPWPVDYLIRFWSIFGPDPDRDFPRSNIEFAISQPKMVHLPRNEKQTYRLNSRLQMWPSGLTLAMTLTLNFQGPIWNFLYLSEKWSDCHETKSKNIDWTPGLKCDQCVWPWP